MYVYISILTIQRCTCTHVSIDITRICILHYLLISGVTSERYPFIISIQYALTCWQTQAAASAFIITIYIAIITRINLSQHLLNSC